jgi:predicted transcriptional regulator
VSFANIAQQYQQAAIAAGLSEQDTSVVMTLIERLAAVELPRVEEPISAPPLPAR